MIMNQKGRGNDNFQTPKYIFYQLDNIFDFTIDIACSSENKLCDFGFCYDLGNSALDKPWGIQRAFCNPPFSQKADFIKKAYEEVVNGDCPICVMVLPILAMDTKAWHEFIEGKFAYEILQGRISFIDPITQKPRKGNNCGSVIVYFRKKNKN